MSGHPRQRTSVVMGQVWEEGTGHEGAEDRELGVGLRTHTEKDSVSARLQVLATCSIILYCFTHKT